MKATGIGVAIAVIGVLILITVFLSIYAGVVSFIDSVWTILIGGAAVLVGGAVFKIAARWGKGREKQTGYHSAPSVLEAGKASGALTLGDTEYRRPKPQGGKPTKLAAIFLLTCTALIALSAILSSV